MSGMLIKLTSMGKMLARNTRKVMEGWTYLIDAIADIAKQLLDITVILVEVELLVV